jgi:hypothetical protein
MMSRRTLIAALGSCFVFQAVFFAMGAETTAQLNGGSSSVARGSQMQNQEIPVAVFDPTRQSPSEMLWQPYPAPPPTGFHWQHTGSPAIKLDPATGQPLPGQRAGSWILVRDGYSMPKVR